MAADYLTESKKNGLVSRYPNNKISTNRRGRGYQNSRYMLNYIANLLEVQPPECMIALARESEQKQRFLVEETQLILLYTYRCVV